MRAKPHHTDKPRKVVGQVDCCSDGKTCQTSIDWQNHRHQNGRSKHHYVADEVYSDSQPPIHDLHCEHKLTPSLT